MSDAHQPPPEITAAPDLSARLEPLLQLVAQQGREIIITQEGRPVARLVPYAPQPGDPPFPPPAAPTSKDAGPPAKDAGPAQGQEEPPILEDIIEIKDADGNVIRRTRFTLQIFGDIDSPIDVEWDAESNPDPLGRDRDIPQLTGDKNAAAGQQAKDAAPEQESLPLFGRDRDILRITGDIESPIDVEWDAESNPDRVLNPC